METSPCGLVESSLLSKFRSGNMKNADDAVRETIADGIGFIYALYAEGRISRTKAFIRLSDFFDPKGETEPALAALALIKNWRR